MCIHYVVNNMYTDYTHTFLSVVLFVNVFYYLVLFINVLNGTIHVEYRHIYTLGLSAL